MLLLPGRKVVTRSPHRRVGYVSCPWLQNDQVQYESLLEQSFIRLAFLCPGVCSIAAQPFRMELSDGSTYTPDYLLELDHHKKLVVEVKPVAFVSKNKAKLDMAAKILRENGYEFLLATDRMIQSRKRHERAALILRYVRSHDVSDLARRHQVALDAISSPITLGEFQARTSLELHQVLALVGRRELQLAPDLSDEVLYPSRYVEEKGNAGLSGAAWLDSQGW